MVKSRVRRKKSPKWLRPVLWAMLLLLIGLVVYPNYSEDVVIEVPQYHASNQPVYEDVKVAPAKVATQKEKPEPIKVAPQQAVRPNIKHPLEYSLAVDKGMALIIDDVGYDLPALKRILALPFPIAISIIPDAPYAKEAAEMAHQAHHIVMLHMPMEPSNPHYRERMDNSFLRADMKQEEIHEMLQSGLEKVPYVEGMNNHMGSLLTSDAKVMAWVMQFCEDNQLFFIDSKTSAKSVASAIAQSQGLAWASRRIFLDHSVKSEDMKKAWASAKVCANQQGGCIVIGHPHPETLAFLEALAAPSETQIMKGVVDLLHVPK